KIFQYGNRTFLCLVGQSRTAGKILHLLVQLERIVTWYRTENPSTTSELRVLNITGTCATRSLLLLQLLGGTGYLVALLRFMCTLSLVRQNALYIQVNSMVVRLDPENFIGERHFPGGLLTAGLQYGYFHCYF